MGIVYNEYNYFFLEQVGNLENGGMEMKNVGHAETAQSGQDVKHTKGYLRIVSLLDDGSFHEVDGLAKSQGGYAEAVAGYGTVEEARFASFLRTAM